MRRPQLGFARSASRRAASCLCTPLFERCGGSSWVRSASSKPSRPKQCSARTSAGCRTRTGVSTACACPRTAGADGRGAGDRAAVRRGLEQGGSGNQVALSLSARRVACRVGLSAHRVNGDSSARPAGRSSAGQLARRAGTARPIAGQLTSIPTSAMGGARTGRGPWQACGRSRRALLCGHMPRLP